MKFKKEHTVEFMLQQAQNEADGYFELTLGTVSKTAITSRNCVSVTVRQSVTRPVVWRRGSVEVTRRAVADTLASWRQ